MAKKRKYELTGHRAPSKELPKEVTQTPAEHHKVPCTRCGGPSRVTKSPPPQEFPSVHGGFLKYRHRECLTCGHRFHTTERLT